MFLKVGVVGIISKIILCLPSSTSEEQTVSSMRHSIKTSTTEPHLVEHLDIDFQDYAIGYRIGDVFANYLDRSSLPLYALHYPNTLAHQYYEEIADDDHGKRNLTAFLHVIDRVMAGDSSQDPPAHHCRDEEKGCITTSCTRNDDDEWACRKTCKRCRKWQTLKDIETPSDTELVVHLRLGDVLTDPIFNEVNSTMEELWNREEGFYAIAIENQKYNYNKREFLALIGEIPVHERHKIDKCTIVGAGFNTHAERAHRNEDYKRLVIELLETEFGCSSVETFRTGNPDRDLLYMAFSNYFIGAMGGYAQIAAACVTARLGWGHALYNYFDGYAPAGFVDEKTKEYIDWSQVNYQRNPSLKLNYSWEYATLISSK